MSILNSLPNVASTISSGNFASTLASATGGPSSIVTSLSGMSLPNASNVNSVVTNLTSGLSGITKTANLDSLSTVIKAPNFTAPAGLLDSTKGVSGSAFSAIADSFKPLTAGVPQNLTAINLKNKLEQAAADVKTATATDAKTGTDALSATKDSLTSKLTGVTNLTNINTSALASGITNLPGGQTAAASLISSATNATSGVTNTLGGLNTIVKNASSSALNGINSNIAGTSSVTGLLTGGALTGSNASLVTSLSDSAKTLLPTTPSVDSLTKGLQNGKQPLSALASTGLSAAGAAALAASINSISSSGSSPIKMPTIATSTVDRSEVNKQITNLLGDKKIPSPNFTSTGPSTEAKSAIDEISIKRAEYITLKKQYSEEWQTRRAAIKKEEANYEALKQQYPDGDPSIDAARNALDANIREFDTWTASGVAKLKELVLVSNKI